MELKSRFMEGCAPYIKIGTNGTGVIFQHGGTATPAAMIYAAEYFHEKGYTVLAPRLAGHATEPGDLARCNGDDFRTELEGAVALLRSCCDKVILCGISMGGVTSSLVGSYADIDGLVIMAAPSPTFLQEMMAAAAAAPPNNAEPQGDDPEGANGWYKPELRVNWKTYDMTAIDPKGMGGMMQLVGDMQIALPNITVPTQLIYSKGDKTVTYEHGEAVFNALQTEKKYLHTLEHSGHVMLADGERETVFEIIEDFIENKL